ncbi:hypothetical protein BLOT_006195, partial [Blomia tropicalis]
SHETLGFQTQIGVQRETNEQNNQSHYSGEQFISGIHSHSCLAYLLYEKKNGRIDRNRKFRSLF